MGASLMNRMSVPENCGEQIRADEGIRTSRWHEEVCRESAAMACLFVCPADVYQR